ncbi:transport protein [Yersinia enterocolitica]|nr:transport protein [Yersinia enterocolitica]
MKLDRKSHMVLLEEIARIKAGGAIADIEPQPRAIIEELTGWKYEQCWGNNPLGQTVPPEKLTELTSEK